MDFRVLGPVELRSDNGRRLDLGSGKQLCVFAVLVVGNGRPQPTDALIDRVWGDDPPAQARSALYSYISRLRKALRDSGFEISQRSGGYLLDVPPDLVDLHRFESASGDVDALRQGLDEWRGVALQDVSGRWAEEVREGLARQRVQLCAEWARQALRLGRHAEVSDRLAHETAEPLVVQLMTALRAQGRHAEALACYSAVRQRLADDLGVDPSPELQEQYLGVLRAERVDNAADAPYLGLRTFEPEDARRFFGRRSLVCELVARVSSHGFLAVFGASGSGKSSLLRAGLVPAVDRRAIVITPGERPLDALSEVDDSADLLLVVDQFEELFTLSPEDGSDFVKMVLSFEKTWVVLGVRADFYPSCARFPALVERLRDRQVLVGPMDADELREAVVEPAISTGLQVEPALVDAVLADVQGEPAALPMVSHALLETWRRRDHNRLTAAGYHDSGGVRGAIAQTADHVYESLDPQQRLIARDVLLRLTALGDDHPDTRRHASSAELLGRDPETGLVLERLAAARLVSIGESTITVTHESLIRGWPLLRRWIAEDRDRLHAHRRLTEDATEWDRRGRASDLLYPSSRLTDWDAKGTESFSTLERDFLAASFARQRRLASARQRKARAAVAGMATVIVALLVVTGVVVHRSSESAQRERLARANALATDSRAQTAGDPSLALLLAQQSYDINHGLRQEAALAQALAVSRERRVLRGHHNVVRAVRLSPDGRFVASTGDDGQVLLWPVEGDRPPRTVYYRPGSLRDIAFSPDSRLIAIAEGGVRILTADGTPVATMLGMYRSTIAIAFSRDGRQIFGADHDGTLWTWQVDGSGQSSVRGPSNVVTATVGSDGSMVATGVKGAIWRLGPDGVVTVLRESGSLVESLALDPSGHHVVVGQEDGHVAVWPVSGGEPQLVAFQDHEAIRTVAFSHDGESILFSGSDHTVRIAQVANLHEFTSLRGTADTVTSAAFSQDDEQVVTAEGTGTLRLWNARSRPDARVLDGHSTSPTDSVTAVAVSPTGLVASSSTDGTVVAHQSPPLVLRGHRGPVRAVAFSRDGSQIATGGDDGTVRVWRTNDGSLVAVLDHGHRTVWSLAFTPDGRVVAGDDAGLWIQTAGSTFGEDWAQLGTPVRDVEVSSDNALLAFVVNRDIWLLSFPDMRFRGQFRDLGIARTVTFSPDSSRVAAAGDDGVIGVWRTSDLAKETTLTGHAGPVTGLAFNSDGSFIASVGDDHTVRLWNWQRWPDPIVYGDFDSPVQGLAMSGEQRVVVGRGTADNTVHTWTCDVCGLDSAQLTALARDRSTRELTDDERRRYLGEPH